MAALISEIYRKCIHLIGLVVPLIYWVTSKQVILLFLGTFLFLFLISELYRIKFGIPIKEADVYVRPLIRPQERRGVGAHVFFAGGAFVTALAYSKDIAIAAMFLTVLADGAAAVVGRRWGRHRLIRKKTLEGTLTLFSVAIVTTTFIFIAGFRLPFYTSLMLSLAGAVAAACIELLPINDNLTIPIAAGLAMSCARHFIF
jgi:dolichol kinase